jgi:DNA-binding MarR family transcriptional regulator
MDQKRAQLIKDIFEDMIRIRRKMADQRNCAPVDCRIPPAQGIVLYILAGHGSLSIKEVAEMMWVSGSAATQLVDSLVNSGLLTRETDENDRRTVKISLTDKGKNQVKKLKKFHLENISQLLEPLSEQELESFRDLQRKIRPTLSSEATKN